MVREIGGPGIDPARPDALRDALKPSEAQGTTQRGQVDTTDAVVVSGELGDLINRVKQADNIRKDRVHEVAQKLQNGTLVTPESTEESAKRIVEGGV